MCSLISCLKLFLLLYIIFFAMAAALKLFLSVRTKHVSFKKIVCLHCSAFPPHIEFHSLVFWENGEDPKAKFCSKWVLASCLIGPRLSPSNEHDAASLSFELLALETLWNGSVMLKWSFCVENFLAAHSPTTAGITGWFPDLHLTEV